MLTGGWLRAVVLVAALVVLVAARGVANEIAIKVIGGAVVPLGAHPSVRMVTARVEADIAPDESKVTCQYVFQNEGPATTVAMGFPAFFGERPSRPAEELQPLRDFRAWVDGVATATTLRAGADRERWYVKEVAFAAGQRRVVRDAYVQPNGSIYLPPKRRIFPYNLSGAGTWHGPVGRLDVILRWVGEYDWGHPQLARGAGGWVISAEGRQLKRSQTNVSAPEGLWLEFLPGWSDLRVDGYRLESPAAGVVVRAGLEYVQMTTRALGQVLRAPVSHDPVSKTTRITGGGHKLVVTTGSAAALVDGQTVSLPAAVRQEGGRQWVAAGPLLEKLGYRALANHRYWRLEVLSGRPPAWEGQIVGPGGKTAEAYLVSERSVLLGEIRSLVAVIPGAEVSSPSPGAGQPGSVRIVLRQEESEPHFENGPPGSEDAPGHELWLTWGSTEAQLDGKPYKLAAAPYVNLLGRGMAPVAALCRALGLQAAYSDENKTVTVSE